MQSVVDDKGPVSSARPASACLPEAAFARVEVATDPSGVLAVWRELEALAPGSPYQTSRFLLPWLVTEGAAEGVEPFIVTAFDRSGRPVALLPFGLRRGRVMRVANFLGGKHANYNMGLFRPDVAWRADQVEALLRRAAAAARHGPDLYALVNQPQQWNGACNPLAALPHQPSPSASHSTVLPSDPAAFFALRHSARTRKVLRNKRERLEAMGPVSHVVASTKDEVARVLGVFLTQKVASLERAGLPHALDRPAVRDFLRRAATPEGGQPAAIELHALLCGDKVVATFGGVEQARRFSGLMLSYEGDPEIARTSPGHLLLASVIGMKCRDGCTGFDLGIGESRYKDEYCPVTDPLFDSFLPVTAKGRLWAAGEAARLRAKRVIKRSPRVWAAVQRLRKLSVRHGSRREPGCDPTSG